MPKQQIEFYDLKCHQSERIVFLSLNKKVLTVYSTYLHSRKIYLSAQMMQRKNVSLIFECVKWIFIVFMKIFYYMAAKGGVLNCKKIKIEDWPFFLKYALQLFSMRGTMKL